jgi:hypothetical protein
MKILLLAASMLCCEMGYAQQLPDYCVYLIKGQATIASGNSKPVPVKQNQFLFKNEVLTLLKNSEITLINKEDKLFVLNTAGSVKVNELDKKFNTPLSSVTKSYAHLVYHELVDPNYDYATFKQNNVGGTRGGVSRGNDCDNLVFPVKDLKASEDSIRFKWHKTSPVNVYSFIIYDSSANEIAKIEVKDTQYVIKVQGVLHGNPGRYYWVVKGKDPSCESDPISFIIKNKDDEQKLIPALLIQKGGSDLLSQLQIVDELEKDNWIYAAKKYYAAIVENNPTDKPLVKSYVLFLLKYGFDDEAAKEWPNVEKKM